MLTPTCLLHSFSVIIWVFNNTICAINTQATSEEMVPLYLLLAMEITFALSINLFKCLVMGGILQKTQRG